MIELDVNKELEKYSSFYPDKRERILTKLISRELKDKFTNLINANYIDSNPDNFMIGNYYGLAIVSGEINEILGSREEIIARRENFWRSHAHLSTSDLDTGDFGELLALINMFGRPQSWKSNRDQIYIIKEDPYIIKAFERAVKPIEDLVEIKLPSYQ